MLIGIVGALRRATRGTWLGRALARVELRLAIREYRRRSRSLADERPNPWPAPPERRPEG